MTETNFFTIFEQAIIGLQQKKSNPLRVAINGVEGTGKTMMAEKFTRYLQCQGMVAIHASIDGFHFNKAYRYRKGRNSAIGYYEDSYDELAFVEKVLLASQADEPYYIPATHDLESDEYIELPPVMIPGNAILITDGAYLFKPNYREHWDLKIYLKTDFETALARGAKRDAAHLGGVEAAAEKFRARYHEASRIYIKENHPEEIANIVVDNTNFEDLLILKNL